MYSRWFKPADSYKCAPPLPVYPGVDSASLAGPDHHSHEARLVAAGGLVKKSLPHRPNRSHSFHERSSRDYDSSGPERMIVREQGRQGRRN